MFIYILIPVITGTDYVEILFLDTGGKPAGTGPIAVPFLIDEQAIHQLLRKLHVGIEVIASSFCFPVQSLMQPINLNRSYLLLTHSPSAPLISFSL